jgi:hypothetical protein
MDGAERLQRLRRLLAWLARPRSSCGARSPGNRYGALFWPDLLEQPRQAEHLSDLLAVAPGGDLRREVEGTLGSLVVPADYSAGTWREYAYTRRGVPGDDTALSAPASYTAFRRVGGADAVLDRVTASPPLLRDLLTGSGLLPEPVLAIGCAWAVLAVRQREPFDPTIVGLEYTDGGLIAVDWERLSQSPFWPESLDVDPHALVIAVERARGLRSGVVPNYGTREARFATLCQQALGTMGQGDPTATVTVFDPRWLARHRQLFDPSRYLRAARRRPKATPGLRHRRHLLRFTFRPAEMLRDTDGSQPWPDWLVPEHQETVFAIEQDQQLLFAPPHLLVRNMPTGGESEFTAWEQALDGLLLIEGLIDGETVGNLRQKSRSAHFRQLHRERLEAVAREIIEGFVALNLLRPNERQRVNTELAARHRREVSVLGAGGAEYHDWLMRVARRVLPAGAVRRCAKVRDPERWLVETEVSFFSRQALAVFARQARDGAPYLHAWATFCLEAGRRGTSFADRPVAPGTRWTPAEDFELFRRFRRNMTDQEWGELLRAVPARTRRTCQERARYVNNILEQVLSETTTRWRHTVGRMRGDDAAAKRAVYLVGVSHQRQCAHLPLHRRLAQVHRVARLGPTEAVSLPLPNTYEATLFRALDAGAARDAA